MSAERDLLSLSKATREAARKAFWAPGPMPFCGEGASDPNARLDAALEAAGTVRDGEMAELRRIISLCAEALQNGAVVTPDCSLAFMAELPGEIGLHVASLREDRDEWKQRATEQKRPGEMSAAEQCQMVVEASGWRVRAEKAEAALASPSELKGPLLRTEARTRENIARALAELGTRSDIGDAYADIDALLARVRALEAEDEWRPIADAPKDGTSVLTWDGEHQRLAHWDARAECGEWSDELLDNVYTGAWTDGTVVDWGMEESDRHQPTHFRPLPAPPASSGESR